MPPGSDAANAPQIDRRAFLRHAAWAGGAVAVAVAVAGGIVTTELITGHKPRATTADFTFVQISDSHLGFQGAAKHDVAKSFQRSIDQVNALPLRPDFVIHTGDLSTSPPSTSSTRSRR